jgi:hypothetical protein
MTGAVGGGELKGGGEMGGVRVEERRRRMEEGKVNGRNRINRIAWS